MDSKGRFSGRINSSGPVTLDVTYRGHRYWCSGPTMTRAGYTWKFWSDHKWPFYHGHFQQTKFDREEVINAFITWLPFDYERLIRASDGRGKRKRS